ncbi:MAG: SusC/RagA family TonB-linked outer membrane protein [Dysgonamonadaceae bacterium]|jgi:iron complex outermembrane receptor protein|nr:SusC/RagA family TonB-linked outer membrane protein [Dysgonamonadaceae bacterium]
MRKSKIGGGEKGLSLGIHKKKTLLTFLVLFFVGIGVVMAQTQVRGTVVDEFGDPVIGATIQIRGTSQGTATDFDGNFTLSAPEGSVLVVSYVGYITQEVPVSANVHIHLVPDSEMLDELVVTALGMRRSQKALGYAVTELRGDDLNVNVVNPIAALQGRVAGVDISGSDGGMFGSAKILIRGVSTLGRNNQPIYVVDGVILDNAIREGNPDWDSQANDFGNELKNLNPDDFETVTVLKGAAATALYGSRGLNGAIVITTRSGRSGQGLGISVSQTFGMDMLTSIPQLQNAFGPGTISSNVSYGERDANGNFFAFDNRRQFRLNAQGMPTLIGASTMDWGPAFDGRDIEYYDGQIRPYQAYKNNFRDAYNTGFNTNTNVAVSGGNAKTTFYTSLSLMQRTGTLPNNEFKRTSFLGKVTHEITDRARIDVSMNFARSNPRNAERLIGERFVDGTWGRGYDVAYGRTRYKGAHGGIATAALGDEWGNMRGNSIWWDIYENNREQVENNVRPIVRFELDLTDWLRFNTEASYNYHYVRYEAKEKGSGYANSGGYYEMSLNQREQTNYNANFVFNKDWNDWILHGFLRGEYYESFQQRMRMHTEGGLVIPNQFFIANSINTPRYEAEIANTKKILSVAFQAGVGWKDQIFVDVTGRNDWSSSLVYADSRGNYSFFYPSISGSWLVSNTFRDELPQWVSFAKIRASLAQVGNDTDPYLINSAYRLGTAVTGSGTYYGLEVPNTAYDRNLQPEKKNSWETGLDWRFINNRIGIDFTYYKENTFNQIMSIAVPYQSGISHQLINAGNIQNQGIELAVNTVPVRTRDWEWGVNFIWTRNRNKIISLHENVPNWILLSGDIAYGNYRIASVAQAGSSYGTLITDSKKKIDKESGLPVLGWNDTRRSAQYFRDETEFDEVGSVVPKFTGGLSTNLRYKNLTMNIGLDARFGGHIASYNARYGTAYGFTKDALQGSPGFGGITWTSGFDGLTYHSGVIPNGIITSGTSISQPGGRAPYVVGSGSVSSAGETYQELMDKGVIEPTHADSWIYWNNAWSMTGQNRGVISDAWFKELNYIALRNITFIYRMPTPIAQKLHAKSLNLSLTGRNLGYLLNTAPSKINPESVSGTEPGEFRMRAFQGVTSSFTFTINATF